MLLTSLNDLETFIVARWFYALGEPIMSDAEYTLLLQEIKVEYPDSEYLTRSWSSDPCPTELLTRIGRTDAIQQIILADKTESIPSLGSAYEVKRELGSFSGVGTLSYKHDGWNMQASYYNGELVTINTRGRKSDSMNAEALRSLIPQTIPAQGSIKVVMEATISFSNFMLCRSKYNVVSQRAAVSTILANPSDINLLSCHAFDVHGYKEYYAPDMKFSLLREWGFNVPGYEIVYNYADIIQSMHNLSENKQNYAWPTDGAVFDGPCRRALRTDAWEEPIYKSYVTGYTEQYNLNRISPSVNIYPILRNGATQRRLNVTNWQRILDNNLSPGAPIAFRIASGTTADFDVVSTKQLQTAWAGREEEYRFMIEEDERLKAKC